MYKKILVPLDGSELAERILPHVEQVSACTGADVILLQVLLYAYEGLSPGRVSSGNVSLSIQEQRIEARREAKEYLARIGADLARSHLRVSHAVRQGAPGHEIVEFARDQEIDLIAMSTQGRTGLDRILLGSVAEYVVRETRKPVLLIRPALEKTSLASNLQGERTLSEKNDRQYRNILVPLDGSRLAEEVLPHVEALARCLNSLILLLRVPVYANQSVPAMSPLPGRAPIPLRQTRREAKEQARSYLELVKANLCARGLDVTTALQEGETAEAIIEFARTQEVDLIAMSTHGRSGLARVVFGSVAEKVLRGANKPVLLIHPQMGD